MASHKSLLALLLLVCSLLGCGNEAQQTSDALGQGVLDFVAPDGRVIRSINIEIAANETTRQQGLMDRRQLTLDQGMLFIFPVPDSQSFWMANTYIPLDIMFVGADSSIVNIAQRTTPLSREFIKSTGLAQFVVEVRGGFSERFGIDESTKIQWQQN